MKIPESELIINPDGSAFHIHMRPEELADTVILVGDPGRVDMIGKHLSDIEFRHESREFVSITGKYNGKRITALSTGIGTDNIDIVMTELDALANVDFETREIKPEHRTLTILRIGTSGGLQDNTPCGSYVFSEMSIGFDGLLNWYEGRDKISIKDCEKAFGEQVKWLPELPAPYFVKASDRLFRKFEDCSVRGITISAPGFYGPQCRVVRMGLALPDLMEEIRAFEYEGRKITNFEMESSAIAGLSSHLGHEAGTICLIVANRYLQNADTGYKTGMEDLVSLALERLCR